MTKARDILLCVAAGLAILYVAWSLYLVSVQALWNLNARAVRSEQALAACQSKGTTK